MVGNVLRQYTMDIVTNDPVQVRAYLARRQAPADYVLPEKLNRLPVTGAGVLSWGRERVSMVCFEAAGKDTLFLFIVSRASVNGTLPTATEFKQVSKLSTASWVQGGRAYVLAGPGGREFLQPYF